MKGKVSTTMKKSLLYFSVFPLILLLCLIIGCDNNGNNDVVGPGSNGSDVASISEMFDGYELASNSGDLDLWISYWDENGIRMATDEPAVYGKDNIKEQVRPMFELFDIIFDVKLEETQVNDNWAFSRGTVAASITLKSGGETTFMESKFLAILKKQKDGSWKVYIDCYNMNPPPE